MRAGSPEDFLHQLVVAIFEDFEVAHAKVATSPELKARADAALLAGTAQQEADYRAAFLQIYNVDLTPTLPPDPKP